MDVRELDVLVHEAIIQLLRNRVEAMQHSSPTQELFSEISNQLDRELLKAETGKSDEQLDQEFYERNWATFMAKGKG
jgi:hypothetical protein